RLRCGATSRRRRPSRLRVTSGWWRAPCGAVLGTKDIYFVPKSELQGGSDVPDFEEQVGAGVPNGEQQLNNGLFTDLDDQQMDDVEEPIDVEEMAILGDDDDTVAGDEGIDEFAEIREDSKHGTTKMTIYYYYLLGFGNKS
ncbi:Os02g0496300, partial [Oryza sativa Japonica Group]